MTDPIPLPVRRLPNQTLHHVWAPKFHRPIAFSSDGRTANLAEYMRLVNQLYDVPPPSSVEVLRRATRLRGRWVHSSFHDAR
jgi:hypothetical protein